MQAMASVEVVGDAAPVQGGGELEQVEPPHPRDVLRTNAAVLRVAGG